MKKEFVSANLDIVKFTVSDVIATSPVPAPEPSGDSDLQWKN